MYKIILPIYIYIYIYIPFTNYFNSAVASQESVSACAYAIWHSQTLYRLLRYAIGKGSGYARLGIMHNTPSEQP